MSYIPSALKAFHYIEKVGYLYIMEKLLYMYIYTHSYTECGKILYKYIYITNSIGPYNLHARICIICMYGYRHIWYIYMYLRVDM